MQGKSNVAGDCILHAGSFNNYGYGVFYTGGKVRLAHRIAYEEAVGPIPEGLTIDHLCCEKRCVNPAHLEAVTRAENTRRQWADGLAVSRKPRTHCPRGHEYTPENTMMRKAGKPTRVSPYCRICWNNQQNARRARRRARLAAEREAA
jgi:hypothetical protein